MSGVFVVTGGGVFDQVFTVVLDGVTVTWNVTRLQAAAKAGTFGPPRYGRTESFPPANWSEWDETDRAKVDAIKKSPAILDEPGIAIASEKGGFALACFADGQHRATARQELALPEIAFYVVPVDVEQEYRVRIWIDGKEQTA